MTTRHLCFVSTGDPTTDTFPDIQTGGSGPIWRLATEFVDRGHEVTVYSGTYGDRAVRHEQGVRIVEIPTPRVADRLDELVTTLPFAESLFNLDSVSASPGTALERLFARLVFSRRVASDIQARTPDVVYTRDRTSGTFPSRLTYPTIHTVKSPDACDFFYERSVARHPANRLLFQYRQLLEEHVVDNADATFVMNNQMCDYFRSKGFSNVSIVSLGIDSAKIVDERPAKAENWVLYVGRFDGNKRPEWLLEAFAAVAPADYELHFVGSGQREAHLRRAVKRTGLADSVVFHGRVPREDVLETMRRATAFVLPSEFENCPNVLIEAMASGCPVITSDTRGARHLVKHDKNGLLFDRDDRESLTKQLDVCLSNQALRERLANCALNYVQEHHTVKRIADKYWKGYELARASTME